MALDFYKDPDEGVNALDELKALRSERRKDVDVILEEASKAIERPACALLRRAG
jgi:hypothetical protein